MPQFQTVYLVEYREVFEDNSLNLCDYLTGISREMLLKGMAYFLGFSNRNSQFSDHRTFLSTFFCAENEAFTNDICEKIDALKRSYPQLTIISPQTSLQIFEFGFENPNEVEIQTRAERERNIFKAILFQNQVNTLAHVQHPLPVMPNEIKLSAITLKQSFAASELYNFNIYQIISCQLIKSVYLFEFLENNVKTKDLLTAFLSYYNCSTWQEYLKRVIPLVFSLTKRTRESYTDIIFEQGENFERDCNFIEKLIIHDQDAIADFDFRAIRSKPFYKVGDGIYRVIFDLFLSEILHKGLYFKLAEINKTLKNPAKVKGDFRGFYCDGFSERYLFYNILERTYGRRYALYSGETLKATGMSAEPDYFIRNGSNIFLYESKDVLINAEIKPTCNYSLYESEFKKKLYFEDVNGVKNNKAVLQLINNIERILNNTFHVGAKYNPKSIRIYPILVLHDHQFNVSGLNNIVNYWFKEELKNLSKDGLPINNIRSICIIDIDTLIYFSDLFENKDLRLEEVIDEYFKFILPDSGQFSDNAQTVLPFSAFIWNHVKSKKLQLLPKIIEEKGFSIFE